MAPLEPTDSRDGSRRPVIAFNVTLYGFSIKTLLKKANFENPSTKTVLTVDPPLLKCESREDRPCLILLLSSKFLTTLHRREEKKKIEEGRGWQSEMSRFP